MAALRRCNKRDAASALLTPAGKSDGSETQRRRENTPHSAAATASEWMSEREESGSSATLFGRRYLGVLTERTADQCVFHPSFSFYRPADRRPLLKRESLLTNGCLPLVTKWCVDEETEREAGQALAVCRQFNPGQRSDSLMNERGSSHHTRTRTYLDPYYLDALYTRKQRSRVAYSSK